MAERDSKGIGIFLVDKIDLRQNRFFFDYPCATPFGSGLSVMSGFDCASAASATDTKGFGILLSGAAHAKATDVQSNTAMIAVAIFS
ncbi:MAG: hypothetical protein RR580_06295 [Christensenellaceae bacterium]